MRARTYAAAQRHGRKAELWCRLLLRAKGYRILASGYRSHAGEIDIVARRGRLLAFVEVKARASLTNAAEAVLPRQQRRIARAAEQFLAEHPEFGGFDIRFDVVLVVPGGLPRHLTDMWRPEA